MTVNVGIIGYKNHALRLIKIINQRQDVKLIYIYHPIKKIEHSCGTNNFNNLNKCDAIIIASPTHTHCDYIKQLHNFEGYIFCEKPPVNNLEDLKYLTSLSNSKKEKFFFNFNLRFSFLDRLLNNSKIINQLGKIFHINIINTHGLAFKELYKTSWRSDRNKNLHSITETVAIHYIDLLSLHFGKVKSYFYSPLMVAGTGSAFDTAHLTLLYENNVTSSVLASYACPFEEKIEIIGTNGLMKIENNFLEIYIPRDTFDSEGNFITPPLNDKIQIDQKLDYFNSLEKSIDFFIYHVKNHEPINLKHYDTSISSNALLLELTNANGGITFLT